MADNMYQDPVEVAKAKQNIKLILQRNELLEKVATLNGSHFKLMIFTYIINYEGIAGSQGSYRQSEPGNLSCTS